MPAYYLTGGQVCPPNPTRNPPSSTPVPPYYGTIDPFPRIITAAGSNHFCFMLTCAILFICAYTHIPGHLYHVVYYCFLCFPDPTSFLGLNYKGRGTRTFWDSRVGREITVNAYLYSARYSDHSDVEFRCNPEFSQRDAENQSSKLATAFGRIPLIFRSRVEKFDLCKGSIF